jgi:hypothetical protein
MDGAGSLFGSSAGSVATISLVLALLALAGVVLLLARQQRLLGQYQSFMRGASGRDLEGILNDHVALVQETAGKLKETDHAVRRLELVGRYHLQNVGIIRYNPFHDTGGDQSFAIALTDGYGTGVAFSSIHSRDVTRVYAKPLVAWESTYPLTDEEQQAIEQASAQDRSRKKLGTTRSRSRD